MSERIAITAGTMQDENNEVAQTLLGLGYELAIHRRPTPPSRDELRVLLTGASGLIAGAEPITREVLEEASGLRVVSRNGVGYDAVDLEAAADLGVVVAYVPDAMVDAVADLALALLLSLARRIPELDRSMKDGRWERKIGSDVRNRTLGLVGTGRIGMATARRARAFGMRLVGSDPYPNPLFVEELGGEYVDLPELFETADYVSLHLPASAESRGLVGADLLGRMKPGAFLINTARGTLVDEEALLAALDSGRPAGAGLDVFAQEPTPEGSAGDRLRRHPAVIALPHVAAFTPVTAARMGLAAMDNLLTVLRGERPAHVANPAVYQGTLRG